MGRPKGSSNKPKEETIEVPVVFPNAVGVKKEEIKPKVRKFSGYEDKMGSQHPLCLNCGHREDMHHDWKEIHRSFSRKNPMTGQEVVQDTVEKVKIYDRQRPCQHACACQSFE